MPKDPARLPPLDLLAAFEAAARHLSFTKAAEERFVTQSAMSRQIKALEDALGAPLFRRSHRALALTDDGERLAQAVRSALAEVRSAVVAIRAPRTREVVSLTTTPGFASLWLIPRLADFLRQHPEVDVRIDASLQRRDLAAEGFDLAIRYARRTADDALSLFSEATLPVCSPQLVRGGPTHARRRPLRHPADLKHHTLLEVSIPRSSGVPLEWEPWLEAAGIGGLQPAARLSFNNYDGAIAAALAGQGVALGRRPLIDDLLKSRQLVAPFKGDAIASERSYFLVLDPLAERRPAVRARRDGLLAQARASVTA
jgi:DNA-binding transcriptional LysR family regulator